MTQTNGRAGSPDRREPPATACLLNVLLEGDRPDAQFLQPRLLHDVRRPGEQALSLLDLQKGQQKIIAEKHGFLLEPEIIFAGFTP